MRWLPLAAVLACSLAGWWPAAARAQVTCTVSGPSLNFGTINPSLTSGTWPLYASGSASYSCTNSSGSTQWVYLCVSAGNGTGGLSGGSRALASGGNQLPIQISNTQGGAQIGDGTTYPMYQIAGGASFSVSPLTGSYNLVATMPKPATAPPIGTYTSNFTGMDAYVYYSYSTSYIFPAPACSTSKPYHAAGNFSISATVPISCTVAATGMSFPTQSLMAAAVTATATITTSCNQTTPVTISLDDGANGTGPTARKMKSGSNAITYGIYMDSGATQPWGTGTGMTASINGSGTLTAYGRVPVQSAAPGSYTDVVNVVITY